MKDRILRFLADLDATLVPAAGGERLDLYHIGRSSLVWKFGFASATEDVDVVCPQGDRRLLEAAVHGFGRNTRKALEHGLYLEEVPQALPPVPGGAYKRAVEVAERWVVLRLFHLESHDLAVTKLKRFARKDQEDIRGLCDLGLLDPDELNRRLESTWWFALEKDGDRDRDATFAHLRTVQRYLREGVWG